MWDTWGGLKTHEKPLSAKYFSTDVESILDGIFSSADAPTKFVPLCECICFMGSQMAQDLLLRAFIKQVVSRDTLTFYVGCFTHYTSKYHSPFLAMGETTSCSPCHNTPRPEHIQSSVVKWRFHRETICWQVGHLLFFSGRSWSLRQVMQWCIRELTNLFISMIQ